jgi:hypothetical protein
MKVITKSAGKVQPVMNTMKIFKIFILKFQKNSTCPESQIKHGNM